MLPEIKSLDRQVSQVDRFSTRVENELRKKVTISKTLVKILIILLVLLLLVDLWMFTGNFEKDIFFAATMLILSAVGIAFITQRDLVKASELIDRLSSIRANRLIDHVSGLYNLGAFQREISERNITDYGFVYIDLKDFGEINFRFGHDLGDSIIHSVGMCIGEISHGLPDNSWIAARVGGDEFSIFVISAAEKKMTTIAVQTLIDKLASGQCSSVPIYTAIGVAWSGEVSGKELPRDTFSRAQEYCHHASRKSKGDERKSVIIDYRSISSPPFSGSQSS